MGRTKTEREKEKEEKSKIPKGGKPKIQKERKTEAKKFSPQKEKMERLKLEAQLHVHSLGSPSSTKMEVEGTSDFEESDDDEKVKLDKRGKLELLQKHWQKRKQRYRRYKVQNGLHTDKERRVFAASRAENSGEKNIFTVGSQKQRMEPGKGHKIDPGGNKQGWPEGVREPKADYQEFFATMKQFGKDVNSAGLYRMATKKDLDEKGHLTDQEMAIIILHYMNGEADKIEEKLDVPVSNLTVHLSKLVSILGVAERTRGFESPIPFDAGHLVKATLSAVINSKITMEEAFFKGTGGKDSYFLGAPSEDKSGVSGADVLRNPTNYGDHLERQMSLLPNGKGDLKRFLNSLSGTQVEIPTMTEADKLENERRNEEEEVKRVAALSKTVTAKKDEKVDVFHKLDKMIELNKLRTKANKLRSQLRSEKALQALDTLIESL